MSPISRPVHLLYAEDNEDDIVMLREAFASLPNICLETVKDGQEAMSYLRRQAPYQDASAPELLLLDIKMPRKDGFAVLAEVKADPLLRPLPVIMFTTSSREEDVVRSYAEGACSYLEKPFGLMEYQDLARQFAQYWTMLARIPAVVVGGGYEHAGPPRRE